MLHLVLVCLLPLSFPGPTRPVAGHMKFPDVAHIRILHRSDAPVDKLGRRHHLLHLNRHTPHIQFFFTLVNVWIIPGKELEELMVRVLRQDLLKYMD